MSKNPWLARWRDGRRKGFAGLYQRLKTPVGPWLARWRGGRRKGFASLYQRLKTPAGSGRRLLHELGRDDLPGLSAELAYRFFLAFVPFLIFLGALGGFVAGVVGIQNPTDQVVNLLQDRMPIDAARLLGRQAGQVLDSWNPGILSGSLLGAIVAAIGATNTFVKAVNRAYGVTLELPLWKKFLLAVALVGGGSLFALFSLGAFLAARFLSRGMADQLGVGPFWGTIIAVFVQVVPTGVTLLMVTLGAALAYKLAAHRKLSLRGVVPGAVVAAIGWLAATYVFSLYVANFGNYGNMYGALTGVVLLLLWFYLSSLVFLLGVKVNYFVELHSVQNRSDSSVPQQVDDEEPIPTHPDQRDRAA